MSDAPFRERPDTAVADDGLRILLAGELAYNPERVLALEERGHTLYGLWTPDPYSFNTAGPLPFGHVQEIPAMAWAEAIRIEGIDIMYALLNWQAVPFAHQLLRENPGVPFVWHFKESPFKCLDRGTWLQLLDLYSLSDGQIYSSTEMRDWFRTAMPGLEDSDSHILDGDLPKRDWFTGARSALLSGRDGEIHTVVPGRPIGLHAPTVGELADADIHLHFYGDFVQGQWIDWIERAMPLAPIISTCAPISISGAGSPSSRNTTRDGSTSCRAATAGRSAGPPGTT